MLEASLKVKSIVGQAQLHACWAWKIEQM